MGFGKSAPDLRTEKVRNRRAGDPAVGIPRDERRGRSRTRTGASSIGQSEDLAYSHACRPSNNLSALFGANSGLGKRIERDVLGKKLFQNRAQGKHTGPLKSGIIKRQRDFEPARKRNRPRSSHPS